MKRSVPLFWKVLVAVLSVFCVGLLVAVIVVSVKYVKLKESASDTESANTCPAEGLSAGETPRSQGLFTDLTTQEFMAVRDYMLKQSASLELKPFDDATVDSNYIHMIQVALPKKEEVLDFLDGGNFKPKRAAKVVIFLGSFKPPVVKEYSVSGQLNNSGKMSHVQRGPAIYFNARPYDSVQNTAVEKIVRKETNKTLQLLIESYDGYFYGNCTDKCLEFIPQAPFGGKDGKNERTTWLKFVRELEGSILHPVSFEILLDFSGADISHWKVKQVYYNGQAFDSIDQLVEKYDEGTVKKIVIPAPPEKIPLFSSYERRGEPQPRQPLRAPKFYEPDGRRYTVSGHHVKYMSWGFDFRLDSITGLQLLDINFAGARIAYELSLQEGIAFYSGYSPFLATTRYAYSAWGLGRKSLELVRGVDCPDTAIYFDATHHVDTVGPQSFKNAVCLFELYNGVPLRRHHDNDHLGGYKFYGGLGSHALVLRSISTIFGADIIFDFVFYQNGAIESKVRTTGYLQTAYSTEKEQPSFGFQIHEKIIGTVQENLFHYKVDLDVGGRLNSFESIEIKNERVTDSAWFTGGSQNVVRSEQRRNERDATFKFASNIPASKPSLFNVYSEVSKNEHETKKGYLIQPTENGMLASSVGWYRENMAPWSSYQISITKQKSTEEKSSSIYNQVNPIEAVNFRHFFEDNEDIREQDLVAWVTIGTVHLSRAEDVPNIATAGESASFFLQPFNYFDFDPSIGSTNAVVIKPQDQEFSDIKVERYGTPTGPVCVPRSSSFHFNGTH